MNPQQQQQVKELLTNAEKHLHRMFLAGCIFGALACFGRADYNLPLYAFLYIMWDQDDVSYDLFQALFQRAFLSASLPLNMAWHDPLSILA